MIFINPAYNNPEEIFVLGNYHPWRHGNNPDFDEFSGVILDLKDGKPNAICKFVDQINPLISFGFAIAVVPSSDPRKINTGIYQVAKGLVTKNRIDATSCLIRVDKIPKLAHGGGRNCQVHFDSIEVRNPHLIRGKEVLLLDDVTTTGNSLEACKNLLESAGAKLVKTAALARTL